MWAGVYHMVTMWDADFRENLKGHGRDATANNIADGLPRVSAKLGWCAGGAHRQRLPPPSLL